MSSNGHAPDHDRRDDAAAYVLGALEPDEAADYRRHLSACDSCREELAALAPVAAALAGAVPREPVPPDLRRRVLRAVRERPREEERGERRHVRRLRRRGLTLAAGIAIVCAAVALAIAAIQRGAQSSRVVRARVTGSPGAAQLQISHSHAELVVSNLPPPPPGRIYEVWLRRGSTAPAPTSALFSVTASGAATVDVPGDLRGVSQILVTQEPDGGSRVSTHSPVIVASLT